MLICVMILRCGGVAADVRYDFALLPLYGVRLVTYILPPAKGLLASVGGVNAAFGNGVRQQECKSLDLSRNVVNGGVLLRADLVQDRGTTQIIAQPTNKLGCQQWQRGVHAESLKLISQS